MYGYQSVFSREAESIGEGLEREEEGCRGRGREGERKVILRKLSHMIAGADKNEIRRAGSQCYLPSPPSGCSCI